MKKKFSISSNFISNNNLYGRYWGHIKISFLHFELCYYKAIETAILLKLIKLKQEHKVLIKLKEVMFLLLLSAHFILNRVT